MKFALVLIALLPFALGASIDEKRFLESLLGGADVLDLARQVISQAGCDEAEAQCERSTCPGIVNKIDFGNALITDLLCVTVCNEVQVLAKHFGTGNTNGVNPCSGATMDG